MLDVSSLNYFIMSELMPGLTLARLHLPKFWKFTHTPSILMEAASSSFFSLLKDKSLMILFLML